MKNWDLSLKHKVKNFDFDFFLSWPAIDDWLNASVIIAWITKFEFSAKTNLIGFLVHLVLYRCMSDQKKFKWEYIFCLNQVFPLSEYVFYTLMIQVHWLVEHLFWNYSLTMICPIQLLGPAIGFLADLSSCMGQIMVRE